MGFFQLFKPKSKAVIPLEEQESTRPNQIVVVQFFYGIEDISDLHILENELKILLQEKKIGTYVGHEISLDFGDGYLFIVGEDAQEIYSSIKPLLETYYFMDKSLATLRSGSFEQSNVKETDHIIRYSKLAPQ